MEVAIWDKFIIISKDTARGSMYTLPVTFIMEVGLASFSTVREYTFSFQAKFTTDYCMLARKMARELTTMIMDQAITLEIGRMIISQAVELCIRWTSITKANGFKEQSTEAAIIRIIIPEQFMLASLEMESDVAKVEWFMPMEASMWVNFKMMSLMESGFSNM